MEAESGDAVPCPGEAHTEVQPRALHVRSLRLYEEFHREAHVMSPPAKLLEIISRCKSLLGGATQQNLSSTLGALRKKGTAHLILNQPKRALSTAEQILKFRVDWAYGYLLKADACLGLGQFALAAQLYQLTRQLMPPEDPTDDFGRTEIDEQRTYLFGCIARMSCVTITQAHESEITAVACWPPLTLGTGVHPSPQRCSTSARALQASVNVAVNDALEAISLGSAYVQLPHGSPQPPPNAPQAPVPPGTASPRSEPTLDQILADKMGRKLPLQGSHVCPAQPRSVAGYISMLDTVASAATLTDGSDLRSSTLDSDMRVHACVQQGLCTQTPSPLAVSEQDPELTTASSDTTSLPGHCVPGVPVHHHTQHHALMATHTSAHTSERACSPPQLVATQHSRGSQVATISSEAASSGSLPWGTSTRTESHLFLATGDLQGCLRLWDVTKLECAANLHGHSSGITCITFSTGLHKGCALLLASADAEGAVIVSAIDLNGNLVESGMLDSLHRNRIVSMHFFAAGHKLVTSSVDTTIRIWNVATGQLAACLDGHQRPVTGMDCTSIMNAVALATCSVHGTWYLWDLKHQRHLRTGRKPGAASMLRFSPNVHDFSNPRPLLVTAHWGLKEASLHLWDVFDPELPGSCQVPMQPWHSFHGVARGQVQDIAFTINQYSKTLMAVAALDGCLIIYDLFARSVLTHMTDGHKFASGMCPPYCMCHVAFVRGFPVSYLSGCTLVCALVIRCPISATCYRQYGLAGSQGSFGVTLHMDVVSFNVWRVRNLILGVFCKDEYRNEREGSSVSGTSGCLTTTNYSLLSVR